MHPAERVLANGELASIIADNHHLAQQPVCLDAAPQRAFGGNTDRVGRDLQCADAEAVEMRLPGRLIGEPHLSMGGQPMDDGPCQGTPAHIVQRRVVDDIVGVSGTQQVEEVQPALARPRAEPGEVVIADLRAEPVLAGMARAGVVHRDPTRGLQAGPQHIMVFHQEPILPGNQQAHHLSLGDADADPPQLCHQPRHGHLPLMVLRQHEATQLWPEMTGHAGRQGSQHHPSIRRDPSLPSVTYRLGAQHDVLHHEGLVALEARAWRNLRLDHPVLDGDPWHDLATPPMLAPLAGQLRLTRVRHAAWLDPWAAVQTLQSCVLFPQLCDQPFLFSRLAQQLNHQRLQCFER